MKKCGFLLPVLFSLCVKAQENPAAVSYADLVNPLMGTDSKRSLSNGNTYPAIALPWGMNLWTPQTGKMGDGWAYQRANGAKARPSARERAI